MGTRTICGARRLVRGKRCSDVEESDFERVKHPLNNDDDTACDIASIQRHPLLRMLGAVAAITPRHRSRRPRRRNLRRPRPRRPALAATVSATLATPAYTATVAPAAVSTASCPV